MGTLSIHYAAWNHLWVETIEKTERLQQTLLRQNGSKLPIDIYHLGIKPQQIDETTSPEDKLVNTNTVHQLAATVPNSLMKLVQGKPAFVIQESNSRKSGLSSAGNSKKPSVTSISHIADLKSSIKNDSHLSAMFLKGQELESNIDYTRELLLKETTRHTLDSLTSHFLNHLREAQGVTNNSQLLGYFQNKSAKVNILADNTNIGRRTNKNKDLEDQLKRPVIQPRKNESEESSKSNRTSEEVMLPYSDPFRADTEVENFTSIANTHKRDKRQEESMAKLRQTIAKRHKLMRYKYYERIFYLMVAGTIILSYIVKKVHDLVAGNVFTVMFSLNNLGYSLRPASMFYKESIKRDMLNDLQPDQSNYNEGSLINWMIMGVAEKIMVSNFQYVPGEYTGQRRPWINGTDPTNPNKTYSLPDVFISCPVCSLSSSRDI